MARAVRVYVCRSVRCIRFFIERLAAVIAFRTSPKNVYILVYKN